MLLLLLLVVVVVLACIGFSQRTVSRSRPIGPVRTYFVVDGNGNELRFGTNGPAIVVVRRNVDRSRFRLPLYNDSIQDTYVVVKDGKLRVDTDGSSQAGLFEETADGKLRSVPFGPLQASLKLKTT